MKQIALPEILLCLVIPACSAPAWAQASSDADTSHQPDQGVTLDARLPYQQYPYQPGHKDRCDWARYPPRAARSGVEGRVEMEYKIDETGKLLSAKISKSSGNADLDQASLVWLKSCTFTLYRKSAQDAPEPYQSKVLYVWKLE
ncbi:energy transducer TonB [Massilia sp. W12]|uniref:energy transducer TonB n=1 Tax=Massilia sp. W12 TaxID=3126507 RepID=UPI0030CBCF23